MSNGLPAPSFADLILHHALTRPERPAIILADRVVTYGMVVQAILRVEQRIGTLGLKPGALVAVAVESPIRHLIVAAALFRTAHPVLSVRRAADLVALGLPVGLVLESPGTPLIAGQRQIAVTDSWFDGEAQLVRASPAKGFANEDAICRIDLSSGTTGRPKATSLTLAAFNRSLVNYYQFIDQGRWDRLLCLPGLTSNWGFTLAAHVLFAGKTLVFADTARSSLQMIALYSIDMVVASSQQLRELVREQTHAPVPCSSLRGVMTAGSLLSNALMSEARARICSNLINQYGSTEAGGTAFATTDRLSGVEGATGYIAPWAVVETVDDNDDPLPPGTEGNLRIRATCQGAPYPPDRTDAHPDFRDNWFYPGDRGSVGADGLLVITGRTSEVINVGGLKIAPELVEDALRQHPAIEDAAAFGIVGEGGLEEIVAAIVARVAIDEKQVIAWSAERGIPITRVFPVDALPKTPSGKVHRDQLKRQLIA